MSLLLNLALILYSFQVQRACFSRLRIYTSIILSGASLVDWINRYLFHAHSTPTDLEEFKVFTNSAGVIFFVCQQFPPCQRQCFSHVFKVVEEFTFTFTYFKPTNTSKYVWWNELMRDLCLVNSPRIQLSMEIYVFQHQNYIYYRLMHLKKLVSPYVDSIKGK